MAKLLFDAPIEPGIGAAGITLGQPVAAFLAANDHIAHELSHTHWRYETPSVRVWARDGIVSQIGVRGSYTGCIAGTDIALGVTIEQVQATLGPVYEDDEDNLVVESVPGLCFETTVWRWPQTVETNLDASVIGFFVYPLVDMH